MRRSECEEVVEWGVEISEEGSLQLYSRPLGTWTEPSASDAGLLLSWPWLSLLLMSRSLTISWSLATRPGMDAPPRPEKIDKIRGAQRGKVDYTVDSDNEDMMPFNFTLRRNNLI